MGCEGIHEAGSSILLFLHHTTLYMAVLQESELLLFLHHTTLYTVWLLYKRVRYSYVIQLYIMAVVQESEILFLRHTTLYNGCCTRE